MNYFNRWAAKPTTLSTYDGKYLSLGYTGVKNGAATMVGIDPSFFTAILETVLIVDSTIPSKKELELLIKNKTTHQDSPWKIARVDKIFILDKQVNTNSPRFANKVEEVKEGIFLWFDFWKVTLKKIEHVEKIDGIPQIPYLVDPLDGWEKLLVTGLFVDKTANIIPADKAYVLLNKYSLTDRCMCQLSTKSYQDCCKNILFQSWDTTIGVTLVSCNAIIMDQLKKMTLNDWETPARKAEIRHETKRFYKNQSFQKAVLTILNYPKPFIPLNDPQMIDLVNQINHLSILGHIVLWYVEDSNKTIIRIASTQEDQLEQLKEMYYAYMLDQHYHRLSHLFLKRFEDNPNDWKILSKMIDDWTIPSISIKRRLNESFVLYREGYIEAACYMLLAQLEPIIRLGIQECKGKQSILTEYRISNDKRGKTQYQLLESLLLSIPFRQSPKEWTDVFTYTLGKLLNFRNNSFHGFEEKPLSSKDFFMLLYLILQLHRTFPKFKQINASTESLGQQYEVLT